MYGPSVPGPPAPHSRQRARARLAVLVATLAWGASFSIVQRALDDLPVLHLLVYRFTLGTLVLVPLLVPSLRRARRGKSAAAPRAGVPAAGLQRGAEPAGIRPAVLLRDGLGLGVMLFLGFTLQSYGLLWTTPSHSAFIIGLEVVMVPPIAWAARALLPGRAAALGLPAGRPRLGTLAAASCATVGLWVLYHPFGAAATGGAGSAGRAAGAWGVGDALTLVAIFVFACHTVGIEWALRRPGAAVTPLAVVQFAAVALLAAPSLLVTPPRLAEITPYATFAILYCGLASTALAYGCQLYAQSHLAAVETAVLLTFEPVVAALFSIAVGRETWSLSLVLGGAIILGAMLLADLGGDPDSIPPAVAAPPA